MSPEEVAERTAAQQRKAQRWRRYVEERRAEGPRGLTIEEYLASQYPAFRSAPRHSAEVVLLEGTRSPVRKEPLPYYTASPRLVDEIPGQALTGRLRWGAWGLGI